MMYNSQVQLICPVLIYATCAFFKSLIAVFLHQNPRTCGTISVNLDIGSTGARGGGGFGLRQSQRLFTAKNVQFVAAEGSGSL